jgi:hypothetical protein
MTLFIKQRSQHRDYPLDEYAQFRARVSPRSRAAWRPLVRSFQTAAGASSSLSRQPR